MPVFLFSFPPSSFLLPYLPLPRRHRLKSQPFSKLIFRPYQNLCTSTPMPASHFRASAGSRQSEQATPHISAPQGSSLFQCNCCSLKQKKEEQFSGWHSQSTRQPHTTLRNAYCCFYANDLWQKRPLVSGAEISQGGTKKHGCTHTEHLSQVSRVVLPFFLTGSWDQRRNQGQIQAKL